MPECRTVRHLVSPVPEWTKMSMSEPVQYRNVPVPERDAECQNADAKLWYKYVHALYKKDMRQSCDCLFKDEQLFRFSCRRRRVTCCWPILPSPTCWCPSSSNPSLQYTSAMLSPLAGGRYISQQISSLVIAKYLKGQWQGICQLLYVLSAFLVFPTLNYVVTNNDTLQCCSLWPLFNAP